MTGTDTAGRRLSAADGMVYQFPDLWCVTGFSVQLRLPDADRGQYHTIRSPPYMSVPGRAGYVIVLVGWSGRLCIVDSCSVPPDSIRKVIATFQMTMAMTSLRRLW